MKQLLLILLLACAACGCQATAERRAVQVLATVTRTADATLDAYAAASVTGKLSIETDRKVAALNAEYNAAKDTLRAAITAYKGGLTNAAALKAPTANIQAITAKIAALPIP